MRISWGWCAQLARQAPLALAAPSHPSRGARTEAVLPHAAEIVMGYLSRPGSRSSICRDGDQDVATSVFNKRFVRAKAAARRNVCLESAFSPSRKTARPSAAASSSCAASSVRRTSGKANYPPFRNMGGLGSRRSRRHFFLGSKGM